MPLDKEVGDVHVKAEFENGDFEDDNVIVGEATCTKFTWKKRRKQK